MKSLHGIASTPLVLYFAVPQSTLDPVARASPALKAAEPDQAEKS